jgi:hypothetical protein
MKFVCCVTYAAGFGLPECNVCLRAVIWQGKAACVRGIIILMVVLSFLNAVCSAHVQSIASYCVYLHLK